MPSNRTTRVGKQSCVLCNGDDFFMLLVYVSKPNIISIASFDMTKKWIENTRKY